MVRVIRRFLFCDRGAVAVDWVVLSAAIVGIGVASVGAVRSGTNALGEAINAALTGATVAGNCAGDYTLQVLTGDLAGEADSFASEVGNLSDSELLAGYAEVSVKVENLRAMNETDDYINSVLDRASIFNDEMQARGLSTPEGSTSFNDLAGLSGACGGGGSGATSDYQLQSLTADDATAVQTELDQFRSPEIVDFMQRFADDFDVSMANGDVDGMGKSLDLLYVAWQLVAARGDDPDATQKAADTFNRAQEAYLTVRR